MRVPSGAEAMQKSPSWGTTQPANAQGVAVTPAIGTPGSWVSLGSALSFDTCGILLPLNSNSLDTASRECALDIGVDEAGGTSYTTRIQGLLMGAAAAYAAGAIWYYFPLRIRAGSTVAARGTGSTTNAVRAAAMYYDRPESPSMRRIGAYVDAIGLSGSAGTVVVPGEGSEGAWTLIGTTPRAAWWWQIGWQIAGTDNAHNNRVMHIDLAVGDGTNFTVIARDHFVTSNSGEVMTNIPLRNVEHDVPAGASMYIRAQCSGSLDTTYTSVVYAMGG